MTKLELMSLSQGLSDLYTGLETDLIANIVEWLKKGDVTASTPQWKMKLLAQLGALDKANIQTIADYAGITPEMLTDVLETAALTAIEELETGFQQLAKEGIINNCEVPVEKTMAHALKTYNKQAKSSLNMVNTVMRYKAKTAAQKLVNNTAELADKQSFLNMLNKATGKVVTGAESRQAAMRQCIKEMTDKGIPAFVDSAGREWSPEAYINMDIRTTANNVAHQAQFDRMDDYEIDLIEVSSHAGARPKCAADQGKIFNRKNKDGYTTDLHGRKIKYYSWKKSSYGEPDGLLGINCGHHIYPFIPGVSYQTYFPYDEYDNQEEYKKTQRQRELERRVRKSKRECIALEQLGDKDGLQKAAAELKTRQQALNKFCSDNNLPIRTDRTATPGYNRSIATKVNAINKRKTVDKSGESGIIDVGSDDVALENQRYGRNKDTLVNNTYIKSGEYRRKFDNATDNPDVNKTLYDCAKTALKHRSGTVYEDMYWIDSDTGKVILSVVDSTDERAIVYTDKIRKAIKNNQNIITIHTHPSSMPPSIGDFNSCCKNKYKMGFIACHNGRIFKYSSEQEISSSLYNLYINEFLDDGFEEFDAQLKTLEKLKENYIIDFSEVNLDG